MSTFLFLHAHPDDEAIFTGLTMRRLSDLGHRVVLVCATDGDLGVPLQPLPPGRSVRDTRIAELEHAADLLGIERLVRLGRRDSGVVGDPANRHRRALVRAHVHRLARQVADIAAVESAAAVFYYDRKGIYGHPDHVAVHHVGATAAGHLGITGYEITVDREYLNFVDRHLVEGDRPRYGRPDVGATSAEITTAIRGTSAEIAAKRLAMAAHSSQIPADALQGSAFDDVYGLEWYIRRGPVGALETLGNEHVLA